MEEKQVAIIGAGISGLLACKYCLSKGYRPIVFESQGVVGGVWAATIESTKLQTFKGMYQFTDFPWPPNVTQDYPDHNQEMGYLQSYATHFDLIRHIKFNSKVVGISYEGRLSDAEMEEWSLWGGTGEPFGGKGKWDVTVEDSQMHSTKVYRVDFVILCVGRFKDAPNIPEFPSGEGPEVFHGKVIHSTELAAMGPESAAEFIKRKRVAVVGFQKTGLDLAMYCSSANGTEYPCTIIYRTNTWKFSDSSIWGVPLALLYFNRFSELLVHKPGEGFILSLLATILSPLRWGITKFVETNIKAKVPLAKLNMIPERSFSTDLRSALLSFLPKDFIDKVEKGSIILKKTPTFSFRNEGILIDVDVQPIKTDVVILATGFKSVEKLKDIFVSPSFQCCIASSPDTRVPLYRECIHPGIPQLAIIGFSESISNLYTSELRCRWLVELLDGTFKLPSIKEMEKDTRRWNAYMKETSGEYHMRSSVTGLEIWYNDQLCKDMGWNHKRKKRILAEQFGRPDGLCSPLTSQSGHLFYAQRLTNSLKN